MQKNSEDDGSRYVICYPYWNVFGQNLRPGSVSSLKAFKVLTKKLIYTGKTNSKDGVVRPVKLLLSLFPTSFELEASPSLRLFSLAPSSIVLFPLSQ
jgi:hypothetical protein